jgi:hypothetical protein
LPLMKDLAPLLEKLAKVVKISLCTELFSLLGW